MPIPARLLPLLVLLTPTVTWAQEAPLVPLGAFNVHGFRTALPSADSASPYGLTSLQDLQAGSWSAQATTEVAAWPMLMRAPADGGALPLVRDFVAVGVSAAVTPIDRVRVGVDVPYYATTTQPWGQTKGGLIGDPRLRVVYGQGADDAGVGGGVTGWLDVPAGTPESYLGAPGIEGGAALVGDARAGGLRASTEVGLKRDAAVSLGGPGTAWTASAAVGWAFAERAGISTELRADGATPSTADVRVTPRAEVAGVGRYRFGESLVFSAGGAVGVATQASSAARRGFVSIGWVRSPTTARPAPRVAGAQPARTRTREAQSPPVTVGPEPQVETGLTINTTWRGQVPDLLLVRTRVGDDWDVLELPGAAPLRLDVPAGEAWSVRVESGGCLAAERSGIGTGAPGTLELPLLPGRRGLVRYLAVDAEGKPLSHAVVRLEGGEEACRSSEALALDAEGRGSHTTGAGIYTLVAMHEGQELRQEMEVRDGYDQEVVLAFGAAAGVLSAR